jgi:hypothetical protein
MNTYGLDFGNPQDYANFAKYAGLGSKNVNPGMPNFVGTGAASTVGAVTPATGAVAPTMSQIGDRFSAVGNQLKQGNFMNAAKTYQSGVAPIAPLAQPNIPLGGKPMPVDQDGDGMISEWEENLP